MSYIVCSKTAVVENVGDCVC